MSKSTNINFQSVVILGLKTALLEAESEINRLRNKLSQVEHEALQWYLKHSKTELNSMKKVSKLNELKNKLQQELRSVRNELEEQKKEMADKENENVNLQFKVKEIKSLLDIKMELLESLNIKGDKVDKNLFNDHRSDYKMFVKNLKTIIKNQPGYPDHQVLVDIRKFLFKSDRGKSADVSKYILKKIKPEKKDSNGCNHDTSILENTQDGCNEKLECSDISSPDNNYTNPQLLNFDENEISCSLEMKKDAPDENNVLENSKHSFPVNLNCDLSGNSSDLSNEIPAKSLVCVNVTNVTKEDEKFEQIDSLISINTNSAFSSVDVMSDSEGDETSGFCDGETEAESPTDMEFCSSQQILRSTPSPENHISIQCMPDLTSDGFTQSASDSQSRALRCISNNKTNLPDMKPKDNLKSSDPVSKQLPASKNILTPLEARCGKDRKIVEIVDELQTLKNSESSNSISNQLQILKDVSKSSKTEYDEDEKIDEILDEMKKLKRLTFEFLHLKQFNDENENEMKSDFLRPSNKSAVALSRNQKFNSNVQNNQTSNHTISKESSKLTSHDKRPIKLQEQSIESEHAVKETSPFRVSSLKLEEINQTDDDACCFKKPNDVRTEKVERTKFAVSTFSNPTTAANDDTTSKINSNSTIRNTNSKYLDHHLSESQQQQSRPEMKDCSKYPHDVTVGDNQETASCTSAIDSVISVFNEYEKSIIESTKFCENFNSKLAYLASDQKTPIVEDRKVIEIAHTETLISISGECKESIFEPTDACENHNSELADRVNDEMTQIVEDKKVNEISPTETVVPVSNECKEPIFRTTDSCNDHNSELANPVTDKMTPIIEEKKIITISCTKTVISASNKCKEPIFKPTDTCEKLNTDDLATPVPDNKVIEIQDPTKENTKTANRCINDSTKKFSAPKQASKLNDVTSIVDNEIEKIPNISNCKSDSPLRVSCSNSSAKNPKSSWPTSEKNNEECASNQPMQLRRSVRSKIEVVTNTSSIPELQDNSPPRRRKTVRSKIVAKTPDPVVETINSEITQIMNNGMERRKRKGKYSEILHSLKSKSKRRKLSDDVVETLPKVVTPEKSRRGRKKKCTEIMTNEEIAICANPSSQNITSPIASKTQQLIEIVPEAPKKIEIVSESDNVSNITTERTEVETSTLIPPKIEVKPEMLLPMEIADKTFNKSLFDMTAPQESEHVHDEIIQDEECGEISFEIKSSTENLSHVKNTDEETPETGQILSNTEEEIKMKNEIISEGQMQDEISPGSFDRSIYNIKTEVHPSSEKNDLVHSLPKTDEQLVIMPEVKDDHETLTVKKNSTETSSDSENDIISDEQPIEMSSKLAHEMKNFSKKRIIVDPPSIFENKVVIALKVKRNPVVSVEKNSKSEKVLISRKEGEIFISPKSVRNSKVESLFETNDPIKIDVFGIIEEMVTYNKCVLARYEELVEFLRVDYNVPPMVDRKNTKASASEITRETSPNVLSLPNSAQVDEVLAKESEEDDDSENEILVIAEDEYTNNELDGIEINKFNSRDANKTNVEPVPANGRLLAPRCPIYCPPTQNKFPDPRLFHRNGAPARPSNECDKKEKSPVTAATVCKVFSMSSNTTTNGIEKNTKTTSNEGSTVQFQFYKETEVESAHTAKEKTPFEEVWESIKCTHVGKPSSEEDENLIACYRPVTHMAYYCKRKPVKKLPEKVQVSKLKKIRESILKYLKEVGSNRVVALENFKSSTNSAYPRAIATGLMAVTITCAKQEMNLFIETAEHLVTLCFELEKERNDFLTHVKTVTKNKLFTKTWEADQFEDTNMVSGIIALSVFYTILCKRDDDTTSLTELILESLCSLRNRSHPIAFGILTVHPTIFHQLSKHCLLTEIILFTLINHSMDFNPKMYKVPEIREIIEKYYNIRLGYKAAEDHVREAMFQFNDDTWVDAIVLLCKRQQFPWSYRNVIMKYLLQIVNRWKEHNFNEMILLKTVLALHQIVRCCPIRTVYGDQEVLPSKGENRVVPKNQIYHIDLIVNSLSDVLHSGKGSRELHETVAFTLCEISFLSFEKCCNILFKWKPMNDMITEKTLEKLHLSMKKGKISPSWYQFVAPHKFAVEYKAKKNRTTPLESRNGVLRVGISKNKSASSAPQQKKKKKKKNKR